MQIGEAVPLLLWMPFSKPSLLQPFFSKLLTQLPSVVIYAVL